MNPFHFLPSSFFNPPTYFGPLHYPRALVHKILCKAELRTIHNICIQYIAVSAKFSVQDDGLRDQHYIKRLVHPTLSFSNPV